MHEPNRQALGTATTPTTSRVFLLSAVPWLWLSLSIVWGVVIFVTDQPAWPLALWIAITVGPLTALRARRDPKESNRTPR